jgi:adenosylmethionine-8-amino-7-oxononanoate aminotransferase
MNENKITWSEKDRKYVWHPFALFDAENIAVSRAEGAFLYTEDGRKIYDGIASWWVNLHGHAHPLLAEALGKQAVKLEQVIFSGFAHEPAAELAAALIEQTEQHFEKVFFSDNGSTAVEVAVKISLQYFFNRGEHKRQKFIAFEGAYHGDTFGAMSVGARGIFNKPFEKHFFETHFVPIPDKNNFDFVVEIFETYCKTGEIAGFIFEPLVLGSAGMRMYEPDYLTILLKIAKKYQLVCIADEVMTGFGRTGKFFACDYLSEKPDLMCLSKGITGGFMPLGATLINTKTADAFRDEPFHRSFLHGHSYTGSPLACALGNASLAILRSEETQKAIKNISDKQSIFVKKLQKRQMVSCARSCGTILAFDWLNDEKSGYFNSKRTLISEYFLKKNILLRPLGNVLYILPPYCSSQEDLQNVHEAIENFLTEMSDRNGAHLD